MILRYLAPASAAIAVGLIVVSAAASSGAEGTAPERFSTEFHGTGTVDCGTFQDNFVDDFVGEGVTFSDASGQTRLIVIHWTHTSTDTNSVTGLSLHEHGHFTETIDPIGGTDTYTGSQEVMTRPRLGLVIQDTGRQVYDADGNLVFFAGGRHHSEVIQGDALFCEGLA